jgi:hypothetical protein
MANVYEMHPAYVYWKTGQYGGRGTFNESWDSYRDKDELLSKMCVCVELVFGNDKVVRVASENVRVTDTAGAKYHFQPLLAARPDIKLSYTLGSGNSEAKTMQLQLPSDIVNPTALMKENRLLAGIGEVSLMFDGGNYDERIVLIRGEMDGGLTFAPDGGTVETSVTDPKSASDVSLPPFVINAEAFSDAPDVSMGERFQLITPEFKYVPAVFITGKAASGYQPKAMVCEGHRLTIDAVYINGESYSKTHFAYGWEQVEESDDQMNPYTAVSFIMTTAWFDFTEGVYVDLSGGPKNLSNPISQIRMLALDYTVLTSIGINESLFAKAESKLQNITSRICVNAGGSSNTSTISFIEGEFCASFPMISMVWESGAYGPVVTDRNQTDTISAYFIVGQAPLMSRASVVQETPKTEIANDFTLRYSYNAMDDVYEGVATRNAKNSIICRASQDMVGYRPADIIDSVWIFEEATAEYVLDWLVGHSATPSYYVEYDGLPSLFFRVSRGDNIRITDASFGWEEQLATVETLIFRDGYCTIGLRVWSIFENLGGGAQSFNKSETIS